MTRSSQGQSGSITNAVTSRVYTNATEAYRINFHAHRISRKQGNSLGRRITSNVPSRGSVRWRIRILAAHVKGGIPYQELWERIRCGMTTGLLTGGSRCRTAGHQNKIGSLQSRPQVISFHS